MYLGTDDVSENLEGTNERYHLTGAILVDHTLSYLIILSRTYAYLITTFSYFLILSHTLSNFIILSRPLSFVDFAPVNSIET